MKLTGIEKGKVIYAGESSQKRSDGVEIVSWKDVSKLN